MFGFIRRRTQRPVAAKSAPVPASRPRLVRLDGATMGTSYRVAYATVPDLDEPALAQRVHAAVDLVDCQMSTWKPDSPLSQFNQSAPGAWVDVPHDLAYVVDHGLKLSRDTRGAFDMTVGDAVNLWGFGPPGERQHPPDAAALAQIRAAPGHDLLEVRTDPPGLRKSAPLYLDLSGIAKGFGVDQIARCLEDAGIVNYLVEIDGELRLRGRKPGVDGAWTVALDTPLAGAQAAWDVLQPRDCALATSGDYRRFFTDAGKTYAHSIDPRSGRPVDNAIGSVTVSHPECMMADAWATALLVLGPQAGVAMAQARNIAALFLIHDGQTFRDVMTGDFERVIG